jgi:uncharacterized protein with LGFP repeats
MTSTITRRPLLLGALLVSVILVAGSEAFRRAPRAHAQTPTLPTACTVSGDFRTKWLELGGSSGVLGNPTGCVVSLGSFRQYQSFQGGLIAIVFANGGGFLDFNYTVAAVHGPIHTKYRQLGGPTGALGLPLSDERAGPPTGRFNTFEHGAIYWSAATGAHVVAGAILDRWVIDVPVDGLFSRESKQVGGCAGRVFLGYPLAPETDGPTYKSVRGRHQHFEKGTITAHPDPAVGTHCVAGAIRGLWQQLGGAAVRGYPTSEVVTTDITLGKYRYTQYQRFQGMTVYWGPQAGVQWTDCTLANRLTCHPLP